jgi:hypothetical protein
MHTRTEVGRGEKQLLLNVSTQNVGGLGLEVRNRQRKGVTGPKLQYLRHCVNIESTDILVLTETRARTVEESQSTYIKKSGLTVTMCTSSGRAAAGVTVLTGPQLQIVEGSTRESEPTGHYTLGVYKTHGVFIIVGGFIWIAQGRNSWAWTR